MIARPYILATGCADPDREYATLAGLARALVAARDAMPEGAGRPIRLVSAQVFRGELPGGRCLSARIEGGPLIGYAFVPLGERGSFPGADLMAAIEAAAQPARDRAAA